MGRTLALGFVFLVVLVGAIVASTPLSFVMERAGAEAYGLNWREARGRVWNGRLDGLAFGAQPIGDVQLRIRPGALMSGRLSYRIDWSGPPGRGTGIVTTGAGGVALEGLRAEARVEELRGLTDVVRAAGGFVRVRADVLRFSGGRCDAARGTVATDVLANLAAAVGKSFGEIQGAIACDGAMLLIPAEAVSGAGDEFEATLRAGFAETSTLKATARTADPDFAAALSSLGFDFEDDAFVYRRQANLGG